jgi:hydroxyacylglutathione hydrolase
VRNLEFTLDREPDNALARALLTNVRTADSADAPVTTLADERQINTFLRLDSASLIERLRAGQPDLPAHPDARTVFLRLRELRNRW